MHRIRGVSAWWSKQDMPLCAKHYAVQPTLHSTGRRISDTPVLPSPPGSSHGPSERLVVLYPLCRCLTIQVGLLFCRGKTG